MSTTATAALAMTLNILCIGDSITQGGLNDRPEYTYRHPLQVMLHDRNIAFNFIGTRNEGLHADATWPDVVGKPFQTAHEGYYGWKTADVVRQVRDHLPELVAPDIALVHLGTNDQKFGNFGENVGKPLRELIDHLRERNPSVIVLLGHLNFRSGPALEIREVVNEVAADLDRTDSPVKTVAHYQGWIAHPEHPWSDTFDWAHPNARGQRKMAEAWMHALQPLLLHEQRKPDSRQLPAPVFTPEERSAFGTGAERTLALLASATREQRETVRILFYGQSITEDAWWRTVVADLEQRFPHADIVAENRALGGFAAQRLVRSVNTDMVAVNPDLVIFHVFGADVEYEQIIESIRRKTCADILIQTDHYGAKSDWQHEAASPAEITRDNWSAFMNVVHLPAVARKFHCGLIPQRTIWRRYLETNNLEASALLRDAIHLNAAGNRLMASIASAWLPKPEAVQLDPFNVNGVRTLPLKPGPGLTVEKSRLRLTFEGNRIDIVAPANGIDGEFSIVLDGAQPSESNFNTAFTRPVPIPGSKWPALTGISHRTASAESWNLKVQRDPGNENAFNFQLSGSETGFDGDGSSTLPFVSNSGRVAFGPGGWDPAYAMHLAGVQPVPDSFSIHFESYSINADRFSIGPVDKPGLVNARTILSDLPAGPHSLELHGPVEQLLAIRVYNPKGR